jgi:hypothetical protein
VANYNVDIEVAVKGQAKVKSLQRELTALQRAVNELRKPIDATPGATKRKQELQLAKDLLNVEKAIKRERSARTAELVKEARLITLQRKEEDRIAAQRQRGLTQYVPFSPNFAAGVSMGIGPEQDLKKLRRRAEIFDRIARNRAQNLQREKTFKKLALESGRTIAQNTGEHRAAGRAIEKKSDAQRKLNRLFQDANKIRASFKEDRMMRGQQRNQKIGGALSSGLIGGGFPLLFGQGGAAAAGGLAGGLAGGAIGGGFGFALSIVGTALGQAVTDAKEFNKTIVNLNSGLDGTSTNASITAQEINTLASEIGLAKEETVELLAGFKNLGANADEVKALAQIFGDDVSTIKNLAATKKLSQVGQAIFDNVEKIGPEKAEQLINELKIKDAQIVQLSLIEAIAKAEEQREVSQARQVGLMDHIFAGLAMAGGSTNGVAMGLTDIITAETLANERGDKLEEKLANGRKERLKTAKEFAQKLRGIFESISGLDPETSSSKADPTSNLKKRLDIVNASIKSEEKVVGLNSEGVSIVRRKLAFEKRIAQIQATGKTEREKLKDQEDIILSNTIQVNSEKLAQLQFEREIAVAVERSAGASEKTLEPVQRKLDAIKDRNAFEREYGELIMSGSTPAAAKQVIEAKKQVKEIDELVEKQLRSNKIQISILRVIVAQAVNTEGHAAAQEALNDALERENEIREKGKKAKGEVKGKKTSAERIAEEMKRLKGELNDLLDPTERAIAAGNAIGDAFSESFKGIISGSMTAQEALANLFQRTADHFLDMTAQIIAAAIKMQAIQFVTQIISSMAGAAASGGGAAAPASKYGSAANLAGPAGDFGLGAGPTFGNVSDFAPATILPAQKFAQGGFVSSPTSALIGEGGEPEYVIPQSKMRESMSRYSRGSRGGGVIPSDGGSSASGDGGVAVAAPIDVRYTVERINSVDYVTADQFQSGMQRAASQGAQRGEQNTLKRLQMSGSTRRRLGM